jgi:site-specific recombinase XerD
MNGRLEKELEYVSKLEKKLLNLPKIFTEYYYFLEAEGKSYTTLTNYINHNVDFMNYFTNSVQNDKFYTDVQAADINRYMASIRHKEVDGKVTRIGDDIRAARWTSLKAFFEFLKNNDYITENPLDRTNRPKIKTEHKVTYLTKKEIDSVLDEIRLHSTKQKRSRDLCLVSLALSTGLRVSAITQINVEDIDLENNTIKVVEKGNKTRVISFGNNLGALIWQCIEDRNEYFFDADTNALFLSQWKRRMTTQAVRDLVAKYTKNITNKHITPHKLRASAATNLAASGVSIQAIAKVLGHENIQTTRRYVEVLDSEAKAATDILDSLI